MRFLVTLSLFLLVSLALACGGGDESNSPPAATFAGFPSGDTTEPQPSQFFEHLEGALPSDVPPDFPVYTNAEIARGDTLGARFAIDLRTEDGMDEVVEFFRAGLSAPPWRIREESPGEGSMIFTYDSEDGAYSGEVAVGKLSERTWILISVVPEK